MPYFRLNSPDPPEMGELAVSLSDCLHCVRDTSGGGGTVSYYTHMRAHMRALHIYR